MTSSLEALTSLAHQIDEHGDWWRFPTESIVQGFMGSDQLFIVGDQPSTSPWEYHNPNRRAFYDALASVGAQNAHVTDLYKKRGPSGALRSGLPSDFGEHLGLFRRELEVLRPRRVVALGAHAYDLLHEHVPEIRPLLARLWHFAYAVRYNKMAEYPERMRIAFASQGV
jgi:hypothetical protein